MGESNVWEPLAAACVVDMVKRADDNEEFIEFAPVIISRLRRLLEDSDYRAVAMDTWQKTFVGGNEHPSNEALKNLIERLKKNKRIQ